MCKLNKELHKNWFLKSNDECRTILDGADSNKGNRIKMA